MTTRNSWVAVRLLSSVPYRTRWWVPTCVGEVTWKENLLCGMSRVMKLGRSVVCGRR